MASTSSREVVLIAPWYYDLHRSIAAAFDRNNCQTTLLPYFPHDNVPEKLTNRFVEHVGPAVGLDVPRNLRHRRFNRRVSDVVERSAKDALVVVIKGEVLYPETVLAIGQKRLTVYWGIDDPRRFPVVMETYSSYAVRFCFEEMTSAELSSAGRPTEYLPNGFDDMLFRPRSGASAPAPADISFVGARYSQREQVLTAAASVGSLGIWGGDWKRRPWRARFYQKRTVLDRCARGAARDSGAPVYSSVPVNLNMHGESTGLNTRVFEIPGAGGLQLCDSRPGIEQFFAPGKEIVLFSDVDDMKDKIVYYLKRPEARQSVADAGCKRAHAEHRWVDRVGALLESVRRRCA